MSEWIEIITKGRGYISNVGYRPIEQRYIMRKSDILFVKRFDVERGDTYTIISLKYPIYNHKKIKIGADCYKEINDFLITPTLPTSPLVHQIEVDVKY